MNKMDISKGIQLICVRFPPSIFPVSTPQGLAFIQASPTVEKDFLCGEFVEKSFSDR